MDYIRAYKNFIYSYNLSDALRVCTGAIVPALVMSYYDSLATGIVVGLGATLATPADGPGPIEQRRNGMLICTGLIFVMSLITGFVAAFPVWLGIWIAIACFIFSMIAVYGARANGIGLSALIVTALTIGQPHSGSAIFYNALYLAAGCAWYTILSLVLYKVRPYRLAQQALGECIIETAAYLRIRARFYEKNSDYDSVYRLMIAQQVEVGRKQMLLREILFESRRIASDSTVTGRTLVMIFIDIVDLFEKSASSYYDYGSLHKQFDDSGVLERFNKIIVDIAEELDHLGLAVKTGRPSKSTEQLREHMESFRQFFKEFRDNNRSPENISAIISLRKIMDAVEDMFARINTLHKYTRYDRKRAKEFVLPGEYEKFVSRQEFGWKLLKDNLSWRSNIFRHSIRVSIACCFGYILSHVFLLGHSYWILLTLIVILKPAYSLSRKRNYERLFGTIAGAMIGVLVLHTFSDTKVLFGIMLFLMIGAYSFLRTNYLVGVIFMTPYVLLMFQILNVGDYTTIFQDRILDTAIGSGIAFASSFFLAPVWEHEQIKNYMKAAVTDGTEYFKEVGEWFSKMSFSPIDLRLKRKNAFVSLANLSEAFARMLSEPKRKQRSAKEIHQFVVLIHELVSHTAALSHMIEQTKQKNFSPDFAELTNLIVTKLNSLYNKEIKADEAIAISSTSRLDMLATELMSQRKQELEQGLIETETRMRLRELKPIIDQFGFILTIAKDLCKLKSEIDAVLN